MKVDIWSDVRCPFCYIGKRKFEKALEKFPEKNNIEVEWHSFELDPTLITNAKENHVEHLSQAKGISKEQVDEMHDYVNKMAKEVGLDFHFDKVVVANSFNAHRLIQLAKIKGVSNEAEEALFKAHFVEGKNIDDAETLMNIGISIGLDKNELKKMVDSGEFSKQVRQDEQQAQLFGINGVPFFVLNNRYGVSGAQSPQVFLQTLNQAWDDFEKEKKPLIITEGEICTTDGNCG
ncbi:MAG TPA: DsbA family oxidoreductase [Hanamia sp.]|nr:DsbA family oxidoreductase [Hanamia sp.]